MKKNWSWLRKQGSETRKRRKQTATERNEVQNQEITTVWEQGVVGGQEMNKKTKKGGVKEKTVVDDISENQERKTGKGKAKG